MNKFLLGSLIILLVVVAYLVGRTQSKPLESKKETAQVIQEDRGIDADFEQINEDIQTAGTWQKLQCTPKTRLDCDRASCTQSQPVVYLILDRANKTFSRCDNKGCDKYDANFISSGIYTNIQPQNPVGAMVKVLGNCEYIEMTTIGLGAIFQNGDCSKI